MHSSPLFFSTVGRRSLGLLIPLLASLASGCADTESNALGSASESKTTAADVVSGSDSGSGWQNQNTAGGSAASDASAPGVDGWAPPPSGENSQDAGSTAPSGSDAGSQDSVDVPSPDADAKQPDAAADAAPVCNKTEPVVIYLSADDSNSMASATVARGLILQGQYAYKQVRPYEFLNYYGFAYPAALPGHVSPSAQLAPEPDKAGTWRLQIGVRAPDFDALTRRRFNIVLTVDTSSSMAWGMLGDTGLDRAKAACTSLVSALEKGDTFSLVTWGASVQVPVDGVTLAGKDDGKLKTACEALKATGESPFSAGLVKAYALAKQHFAADRINRVVLISDGGANVGEKDEKLIAGYAKSADGKEDGNGIYLMGAGVGDPWNYNDKLMNAVTDAGKGAYVFLDSQDEAQKIFAQGLLRHLEVAARNVQVQVTLPPTFGIEKFYGEQVSTIKEEVDPQHLAANDAMVFHQTITSCDPKALTGKELIQVVATWQDPQTGTAKSDKWSATFGDLLAGPHALLDKGAAVVAVTDALQAVQKLDGKAALPPLEKAASQVAAAQKTLVGDADLKELADLLAIYKKTFEAGQIDAWQKGGSGSSPITSACNCTATGSGLPNLACALDLCDPTVLLGQTLTSPTQSKTEGTFAAVTHFGAATNELKAQTGGSYALLATGPATGTSHSVDIGGSSGVDPFAKGGGGMHNAVAWRLHLKAPPGANGIRFRHVFFSEEYDDYVGTQFNDKFYAVLEAGSTNGGTPTVINYTDCRKPQAYSDFVCSPGMQFCNPRARYCYIAINTALSECCWLDGCPNGKAKTSIAGTGYECAASQSSDGANSGSSTGWLMTEWPIEPGEEFWLTFHVHDTGDGILDSEVILDGLQFVGAVTPGTWAIEPM